MDNIFYKNLQNFLQNNQNKYSQTLLKENPKYKILYDCIYSNLRIISKKLPKDDKSLDNLFDIFSQILQIENSFYYIQGIKDCKKIQDFFEL